MAMWKLKSCPRCEGDVFLDNEDNTWYEQCLQCGYRHEVGRMVKFSNQSVLIERKPYPSLVSAHSPVIR